MKRRQLLQAASAALALPRPSWAQAFPAKPIRYIVPVAAGRRQRHDRARGRRALGQAARPDLRRRESQSGGGGVVACTTTARAAPDGYTLMQGYVATHGTTPATRKVSYDAIKDFTPIGMIGATPNVLAVGANVPAKDVKEFIDVRQAQSRQAQLRLGRARVAHAPDDGAVQAGNRRLHGAHPLPRHRAGDQRPLGGQTQAMFPGLAAALPHLRSGRMRALAVTGKQRSPQLKDVPTMDEVGFKGFDAMQWYGSVGPANMPADVVKRLNETQVAVLKAPDLAEKLAGEAVEPWPMTPEQFGQYIRDDIARWTKLAQARNIRLDE